MGKSTIEGTCTSGTLDTNLRDRVNDHFITAGVQTGDWVYNVTDDVFSTVDVVVNAENLTLDDPDLFSLGDTYMVVLEEYSHAIYDLVYTGNPTGWLFKNVILG